MKMSFLPVVTLFCFLSLSSAWQSIDSFPPVKELTSDPCWYKTCQALPIICKKIHKTVGSCCPACSCEDDSGRTYEVGQSFTLKREYGCIDCFCDSNKSITCKPRQCELKFCYRYKKTKDGCCLECDTKVTPPPYVPDWEYRRESRIGEKSKKKARKQMS